MLKRLVLATFVLLSGSIVSLQAADSDFPFRKNYPEVSIIETADLTARFGDFTIVDVRSPFEYGIMHIKDARNIPLADSAFADRIKTLSGESSKALVFYCNGHTCEKAYQAAIKARQMAKATHAIAYDGGIFDWAAANPKLTTLLDKPELDPKALIGESKFKAHLLSPKTFIERARTQPSAQIIDLRDTIQSDGISIFATRDIRTGFDMKRLREVIERARQHQQAVFFYDAAGHQIKHLQYFIEDAGLADYYFLEGGMVGYYAMIQGK
ncbi:MAG: rhodanese-like domain-containing protein [Pseudomonadota bacterium]